MSTTSKCLVTYSPFSQKRGHNYKSRTKREHLKIVLKGGGAMPTPGSARACIQINKTNMPFDFTGTLILFVI